MKLKLLLELNTDKIEVSMIQYNLNPKSWKILQNISEVKTGKKLLHLEDALLGGWYSIFKIVSNKIEKKDVGGTICYVVDAIKDKSNRTDKLRIPLTFSSEEDVWMIHK